MSPRTPTASAPILSSDALDAVHRVTQKCRRILKDHEDFRTSWVNSDKAREVTRTFAIEEFDLRMDDYTRNYDFSTKMVPPIIKATVSSILSAFPADAHNPREELEKDLSRTLQDYVRHSSDLRIPSTRRTAKGNADARTELPSLAHQIKQLCEECRATYDEVAEGIGVSTRSVARHVSDDSAPSKRHIRGYEQFFSKILKREVRLKTS